MVWNAFAHRLGASPWNAIERLHHEMDRVFSGLNGAGTEEFPPVNVWTGPEGARLHALLPGLDAGNLDLAVSGDTLTLKGEREQAPEGEQAHHRREREAGRFARTVQLPFPVDGDAVKARFRDGVLEIELPRAASDKPRRITVHSS